MVELKMDFDYHNFRIGLLFGIGDGLNALGVYAGYLKSSDFEKRHIIGVVVFLLKWSVYFGIEISYEKNKL